MLVGQISDGLFTPIVGLYSDKLNTSIGKRKPWYIAGTILVPLSFIFAFQECLLCSFLSEDSQDIGVLLWYCCFAVFFNIGWACIQISHISMIPSLSPLKEIRDKLIGIRNGFTYISFITVLLLAFILINTVSAPQVQFLILSVSIVILGLILNMLFILFFDEAGIIKYNEPSSLNQSEEIEELHRLSASTAPDEEASSPPTWRYWLAQPQLYAVSIPYTLSRLSLSIATMTMPFYLTTVLGVGNVNNLHDSRESTPWEIAIIPLCLYGGSAVVSFGSELIGESVHRKLQFAIGVVIVWIVAFTMLMMKKRDVYALIPLGMVYGAGFALTLSSSMGFISAFVGDNGKHGAFVWGFISLFEKFASGIVIFLIVVLGDLDDDRYVRLIVPGVPMVTSICGGISLIFVEKTNELSLYKKKYFEDNNMIKLSPY